MKTPMRLTLAVVAFGVALTACSPQQVGSAAIVGEERITSSRLDQVVRDTQAALNSVPQAQQQMQQTIPQMALLSLVEVSRYTQLGERNGIGATDGEVDAFLAAQGGAPKVEQTLITQGVAPEQSREYIQAFLTAQKLLAKYGGGTDEAAMQRGQQQLVQELETLPVSYNPRYGKFDPQQGFVDNGRFGKAAVQEGAPQQGVPQEGAPQQGAPQEGVPQQGVPQEGAPQDGG
ncbi:SurA N-terminal domain-containing protein [Streptosporangium soli]|nr:SurA N-terminal domain-containing protein [Streptosporangium sp. KLBMP 9127]